MCTCLRSAADVADCRAMIARVGLPASTCVLAKLEDVEGLVAHKWVGHCALVLCALCMCAPMHDAPTADMYTLTTRVTL